MSKTLKQNSEANKILPRAQWPKGVRCPFKRVTKRVVTYGVNILGKHLLETRQSDGIIISYCVIQPFWLLYLRVERYTTQ